MGGTFLKKLSTYVKKHAVGYILAIICLVISVALDMISPQLTRRIIDDVIGNGNLPLLKYLLIGIFSIGVGRCIMIYVKEFTFDVIGAKIAAKMREDLFRHIQGLSADFFDKNSTGELMARVKEDIDRIWDALTYVSMLLIEVVIHTTLVLTCMYRLNWKLAIIPTIAMIFCGFMAIFLRSEERRVGKEC